MNTVKKLIAFSFLFIFACGEVGSGDDTPTDLSSSSDGDSSSGSNGSSSSQVPTDNCNPKPDPSVAFCYDGTIYSLCGSKKYNPPNEFCSFDGKVNLKCGGKEFDANEEFCFKNKAEELCGGQPYDLDEEFCADNFVPYTKCGGAGYNIFKQFCYKNVIYSRCESSNPKDEFCEEAEEYAVCGIERYKTAEHFCIDSRIYLRCGDKKYNPIEEFCFEDNFYLRCGGKPYDPEKEFCFSSAIYSRCGDKQYNPTEQFCYSNARDTLYAMCGGEAYNPEVQFCRRTKIISRCGDFELLENQICYDKVPYNKCGSDEQFCDSNGIAYKVCGGTIAASSGEKYNIATHFCYGNGPVALCGGFTYEPSFQFCDGDKAIPKCETKIPQDFGPPTTQYDKPEANQFCSYIDKSLKQKCGGDSKGFGGVAYNDVDSVCVGGMPVPIRPVEKCVNDVEINTNERWCERNEAGVAIKDHPLCFGNGVPPQKLRPDQCCNGLRAPQFDNTRNFCGTEFDGYDSKIYPKCGTANGGIYNPIDTGCFNGVKYPRCTNVDARGVCISNTALRCKQLKGNLSAPDSIYIRDPLPGMQCQANTGVIDGPYTDSRNDEFYGIVQIGSQVWLRKNLNYIDAIPPASSTCPGTDGCLYKNTETSDLCPEGFNLPTQSDWDMLVEYAGGEYFAGDRLKTASDWGTTTNDIGTNAYGFDAKPPTGSYYHGVSVEGAFWWEAGGGYYRNIISADANIRRHFVDPLSTDEAFVRCVRYSAILPR